MVLAAAGPQAARAFVEVGALALGLAVLARVAGRLGVTTIPLGRPDPRPPGHRRLTGRRLQETSVDADRRGGPVGRKDLVQL
jgi:hypothetical protein